LHDTTLQSAVERAIELRARLEREVERRDLRDNRTLQLGSALDELSDAVCVTHPDGRIISANRAFHVLAGLGPLDTVSHLSLDALLCATRTRPRRLPCADSASLIDVASWADAPAATEQRG
jgi:PAS domain-containing protein